jgi:hypothetical protein
MKIHASGMYFYIPSEAKNKYQKEMPKIRRDEKLLLLISCLQREGRQRDMK